MEMRNDLGLISTIEDDDEYEANTPEEESDDEVNELLLHSCT